MKKILALNLIFAMVFSVMACGKSSVDSAENTTEFVEEISDDIVNNQTEITEEAPITEYERAVWYGFLPEELKDADPDNTVITWKQYCTMIANVFERTGPEHAERWQEQAQLAFSCDEEMTRDQGCVVINRAKDVVLEFQSEYFHCFSKERIENIFDVVGEPDSWDYEPIEGHDDMQQVFESKDPSKYDIYSSFIQYSVQFCHEKSSYGSYEPLFDTNKNINDPLTLRDALLSVIRFYESNPGNVRELWLDTVEKVEAEADSYGEAVEITEMRTNILNTKTNIVKSEKYIPGETYSGTAYYVSNNGDDNNDGKTPETAWATLDKVASSHYEYGDAIFFERGGIWRGHLRMPDDVGITLSAYGEGDKPIITASPENAADAAKWELYHEGSNGEKIWKYYQEVADCALIVFDEKETALKTLAVWSGNEWQNEDGTPYDVKTALIEDMTFFSDDGGKCGGGTDIYISGGVTSGLVQGPLYLRCDEGNPGELYEDIELCVIDVDKEGNYHSTVLWPAWESTIDNLCIKYYPMAAISPGQQSCLIQNCEFAWGGGCVQIMENGIPTGRMGDAICSDWVTNYTVKNSYFHHHFTHAQTLELDREDSDYGVERNISFVGNLVEKGGLGLMFRNDSDAFENVLVSDNIFNRIGTDWAARSAVGQQQWAGGEVLCSLHFFDNVRMTDSKILNNRFYYSSQFFLYGSMTADSVPDFEGNKFYMAENTYAFALWQIDASQESYHPILRDEAEIFLTDVLGDETGEIIFEQ